MSFLSSSSVSSLSLRQTVERGDVFDPQPFDVDGPPDGYGVFAWWPNGDDSWIHPYDRPLASDFVPGQRVWQRYRGEAAFDLYCHGSLRFRAQPRLWMPVQQEGYWIGDWVEVRAEHAQPRGFVGRVQGVFRERRTGRLEYELDCPGRLVVRRYSASSLRPCRGLAG